MLGRKRKGNDGSFFEWMQRKASRQGLHLRALADLIGVDDSSFYFSCHHPETFRCVTAAHCAHHLGIPVQEIIEVIVGNLVKNSD